MQCRVQVRWNDLDFGEIVEVDARLRVWRDAIDAGYLAPLNDRVEIPPELWRPGITAGDTVHELAAEPGDSAGRTDADSADHGADESPSPPKPRARARKRTERPHASDDDVVRPGGDGD